MNTRSVEILGTVITATHGSLIAGDKLINISAEFAAHLVDDCRADKYIDQPAAAPVDPEKPAGGKKAKAKAEPGPAAEPLSQPESTDDLIDAAETDGGTPSE